MPPPTDAERAKFIDTTAMFVAKNGPAFEQMARERQRGDPKFSFLHGGPDEGYYRYKLGECRRELGAGTGAVSVWANMALGEARPRPLDADDRARMLGETPLPATMSTTTGLPHIDTLHNLPVHVHVLLLYFTPFPLCQRHRHQCKKHVYQYSEPHPELSY